MINPETLTRDQNKKEFARFVEDFNTGELSSSLAIYPLLDFAFAYAFALMS